MACLDVQSTDLSVRSGRRKSQNVVILSEAKDLSAQCVQLLAPTRLVGNRRLIFELATFPQPLKPFSVRSTFAMTEAMP
jgi:hypothetical protein